MANVNLINDKPRYGEAELDDAVLKEIRFGTQLKVAMEERRAMDAREQAHEFRKQNRTAGNLGKIAAVVPDFEFYNLINKYGYDEVHSREFLRSLRRHEPDLCVNRV